MMFFFRHVALGGVLFLGLVSCAAVSEQESASPPPMEVAAHVSPYLGQTVRWGGRVVSVRNLEESSEIQVVAFPLVHGREPDLKADPLGRFIARRAGYVESMEYSPGRLVVVTGTVSGVRRGKVGEADYRFAVVEAEALELLPEQVNRELPRVNFGFSIGSGGRSGVGIGIGF